MKEVQTRRKVPAAVLALICVSALGLFQVLMLGGAYEMSAYRVKSAAPWFYDSFRKLVGEHPSTRPEGLPSEAQDSRQTAIETVAGINPEKLTVNLEDVEPEEVEVPAEKPETVIPVSEPRKNDPPDSDEPVG